MARTVKVRINKLAAGPGGCRQPGEEHTVTVDEARAMLADNAAELCAGESLEPAKFVAPLKDQKPKNDGKVDGNDPAKP